MSNRVKNWWIRLRLAVDEASHLAARLVRSCDPHPQTVCMAQLEDRLLLSASPAAVAAVADGDLAQQAPAIAAAPLDASEALSHGGLDGGGFGGGEPTGEVGWDEKAGGLDSESRVTGSGGDVRGAEQAVALLDRLTDGLLPAALAAEQAGEAFLVGDGAGDADVVLVDARLDDSSLLIQAVRPDAQLFVYDSAQDSASEVLGQVIHWAETSDTRIRSLSILAHGSSGGFLLGNQWITADTLSASAADWQHLDDVLADGGNIYLLGCNLVSPDGTGQRLLDDLSGLTGGDVFGSDDLTGAGGDWVLEAASSGATRELASGLVMPLDTDLLESFSASLGWYDPAWGFRKQITVDHTMVAGGTDLTSFPVLVSLVSDADLASRARGDGFDILFTASDGTTKLNYEREQYAAGTLAAWVQIPTLSASANTVIYLYYGNAAATDQQNVAATWDSNFQGVWHLAESAGANAGEFKDSSANSNDGQGGGGIDVRVPVQATGKVGFGQDFSSANSQFISVPDDASLRITGDLTMEAWINASSLIPWMNTVVSRQYGSGSGDSYGLAVEDNGTLRGWFTGSGAGGGSVSLSSWHHVVVTRSGSTAFLYVDGTLAAFAAGPFSVSIDPQPVLIGANENDSTAVPSEFFNGLIDEVRLSNSPRSAGWIATEYANQSSPSTFVILGLQEYASLEVDTTSDTADGDTSSINALLAGKGADGKISLREAILATNNTANVGGPDRIRFNIVGAGPHTINVTSALPAISDAVFIDGWSEPDFAGRPVIELNGAGAGAGVHGLRLTGNDSTIRGLVINRFNGNGIAITGDNNAVEGNFIGLGVDGMTDRGNAQLGIALDDAVGNRIGGTGAGAGNVISGNAWAGIHISGSGTTGNLVSGNYIGTDITGTAPLGNGAGGNNGGIDIDSSASDNVIGGTGSGAGNLIAYNTGPGVKVEDSSPRNSVRGNRIFSNTGLGIDLANNGVTANDAGDGDAGPNALQNYPVLTGATVSGADLTVTGTLNGVSLVANDLDFYWSPAGDPIGYGEGQAYIGSTSVITDGTGNSSFNVTFAGAAVPAGAVITATATDSGGNTSEFAQNVLATRTAQLTATQDTYIRTTAPGLNYGNSTSLIVDRSGGGYGNQRTLLQFDLSPIPAGATIVSATLTMQATQNGGAFNNNVYEVTQAWVEGNGNGAADAANWNERSPGTNWSTVGGSFNTTPVATLNTGAIGPHSWDLTTLVQDWFAGTTPNNGILLGSQDTGTTTITYDSSEGATPPQLVVNYVPSTNTAPALDASRSPALTAENEDAGAPVGAVGTLVSSLVDFAIPAGQVDNVADPDPGALLGIAVTAADTTRGSWYYSINGGTSWNALGSVAEDNARLLAADASTRIYFRPNANWNGTFDAVSFRAWDRTSGTNGGLADTTVNGGSTAFSTDMDTASLTINSVNDAPAGADTTVTARQDTAYTLTAGDFGFSDPSDTPADSLAGVKITTLPSAGSLTNNGSTVTAGQTIALADIAGGKFKFTPAAGARGVANASFGFQVQDSGGTANGGIHLDPTPNTLTVDVAGVQITPAGGLTTTESGGTAQFAVVLATPPTSAVTISVSSSDTTEGTVSVTNLSFTSANWNVAQTVTVTGVDDLLDDGNIGYSIQTAAASSDANYNGLNASDVSVTNADNDTHNTLVVDTTNDVSDGNTSSIAALLVNKGADGFISLREAITAANNTANGATPDEIRFAATGAGTFSILSQLPSITDAVILDGTTAPGFTGTPIVHVDGRMAGAADGLVLEAGSDGSTIRGLSITGYNAGGSQGNAIVVKSDSNRIAGNFVGLKPDGSTVASNRTAIDLRSGAQGNVVGGTTATDRNVLSGNTYAGIAIHMLGTDANQVLGNDIGPDASGTTVIGNGSFGVVLWDNASGNMIGGPGLGEGNHIAGNGKGVLVDNTASNTSIRGNSIHNNTNLGIDLGNDGVTANDPRDLDAGPNGLQNSPVLTSATVASSLTSVSGILAATPNASFVLDFYTSPTGDPSGYGEGQRHVGSTFVTTSSTGDVGFGITLGTALSAGITVTATATDANGNTSEFSNVVAVSSMMLAATNEFGVPQTSAWTQETSAEGRGSHHAVALTGGGNYVVVWSSQNQDGSGWGVYGRQFDASGTPKGTEFLINTTTAADQCWAYVDANVTGEFVVAWTESSGGSRGVAARKFDATGNPLTGELSVNTYTLGDQDAATVAMTPDGGFIVAWDGSGPGDSQEIFARRYDAAGNSLDAAERLVHNDTSNGQWDPSIAVAPDGSYVIMWDDRHGVEFQRFDTIGTPLGPYVLAENELTAGDGAVATASDGSFVVVWRSTDQGDGQGRAVLGRMYAADGTPRGAKFLVNTTTANDQTNPSLAMDATGSFLVVWEGDGPGDSSGIFGQQFNSDGSRHRGEFRINQTTTNTQHMASAAMQDAGHFVVVWSGNGPGDSSGVFARQFANAVPIANDDLSYTTSEDTQLALSSPGILANDSDPDGDALSAVYFSGPAHGSLALTSNGSFSYIPSPNFFGTDSFTYFVSDGVANSTLATVTISVASANDAPTDLALSSSAVDENAANATLVGVAAASDPDAPETWIYTLDDNAGGRFTINGTTGELKVVDGTLLDYETAASHNVTIRVTDSGGLFYTEVFTVAVRDVNEPPALTLLNTLTSLPENANAASGIRVADLAVTDDALGTNDLSLHGADAAHFQILANGLWLSPDTVLDFETKANYQVTVKVDDPAIGTAPDAAVTYTLAVNDVNEPPLCMGIADVNVVEDGPEIVIDLAAAFCDPDAGDAIVFTVAEISDPRLFADVSLASGTSQLALRLAPNKNGASEITVRAADGLGHSVGTTFAVLVAAVNDAPVAKSRWINITEPAYYGSVARRMSDVDGDTLTAHLVEQPAHGTVVFREDGSFSYAPDAGYIGLDRFTYGASDGQLSSNAAVVWLNVDPTWLPSTPPPAPPVTPPPPTTQPPLVEMERPAPNAPKNPPAAAGPVVPASQPGPLGGVPDEGTASAKEPAPTQGEPEPMAAAIPTKGSAGDENREKSSSGASPAGDTPARLGRGLNERIGAGAEKGTQLSEANRSAPATAERVELAHVASSGELWRKLDTFHETVCPSLEVQTVVVGSVGTVASGFTVGYVLWALRSGLVLSSLFASMPAWTLLDPLAGVTIAEGMRKDEDEESLEQIAEKQSKRLSETHGKGAEMHN